MPDVVIGVGASLNRHTLENGYMYPNAKYVHIDQKAHLMMGGGRAADAYVQSDAKIAVEELEKLLGLARSQGYRLPHARRQVQAREPQRRSDRVPDRAGTVDPREAVIVMDQIVPPEIGVLSGSWHDLGFLQHAHDEATRAGAGRALLRLHRADAAGGDGAVVATKKPAMLLDGDASVMMHLAEFETAVRYNMPLLVVVMNNEALGAEYYKLDAHKMEVRGPRSPRRIWARSPSRSAGAASRRRPSTSSPRA
jgi:thiamine pyrophosphate-dependent acetolactate synthase large subunit-like protein